MKKGWKRKSTGKYETCKWLQRIPLFFTVKFDEFFPYFSIWLVFFTNYSIENETLCYLLVCVSKTKGSVFLRKPRVLVQYPDELIPLCWLQGFHKPYVFWINHNVWFKSYHDVIVDNWVFTIENFCLIYDVCANDMRRSSLFYLD